MTNKNIDTFDIEQKAISVFSGLFTSWIKNELKPDMEHIDYKVTTRENNEPTGKMFGVQLKGQNKSKYNDDSLIFPKFKVKHLLYYIDKLSYPVFLFVVDNSTSLCYWLFLQKYIKEKLRTSNWREKATLSIHLPKNNLIKKDDDFSSEIEQAMKYMQRLHSTSMRIAYESELSKLKEIDPRFNIETRINSNNLINVLKPNTDIEFEMSLLNKKSIEDFSNFNKSGNMVTFNSNDVDFQNLPIFNHLKENSQELNILFSKRKVKADFYCQFDYFDENYFLVIPGYVYSGTERIIFCGELIGKLLQLKFNLNIDGSNISVSSLSLNLSMNYYLNKTLLSLPLSNELLAFVNCLNNRQNIRTKFLINDLEIFTSNLVNNDIDIKIIDTLELLNKCIAICKYFKINPVLSSFNEIYSNEEEIVLIHSLLKSGMYKQNPNGKKIVLPIYLKDNIDFKKLISKNTGYDFMLISDDTTKSFLGHNLNLGKLVYSYLNWFIAKDIDKYSSSKPVNVELISNENSMINISRII